MQGFEEIKILSQSELLTDAVLLEQYVNLFIEVYNSDWQENWTIDEALKLIKDNPHSIYTLGIIQKSVCGFACGSIVPLDSIKEIPKSGINEDEIIQEVLAKHLQIPPREQLYLHFREFVVKKNYRSLGFFAMAQLAVGIITSAVEQGVRHIILRTAKNVPMHRIVESLNFKEVYQYSDGINVIMVSDQIEGVLKKLKK